MQRAWCAGLLAGLIALTGCAGNNEQPPIAMTMMQPGGGAPPPVAQRAPGAVIEKVLLRRGRAQKFTDDTLLRVRGEKSDFRVLTGPLGPQWNRAPAPLEAGEEPEDAAAIGAFHNPDGEWSVTEGYAYIWGWWPVAITRTVSIGTEGSELLVIIDSKNNREIVVLLEGVVSTFKRNSDGTEFDVTKRPDPGEFVVVTGATNSPSVTDPAALSTDADVQAVVDQAKKYRKILERW